MSQHEPSNQTKPSKETPGKHTYGKIAIAGFGKTGKGLLDYFIENKNYQTLFLFNDTPIADSSEKEKYEADGVVFLIGEAQFPRLADVELIILSPGINGKTSRFDTLREKGVKIISEIELAYALIKAPIIAVTGTNGKSTTVTLIHHLLQKSGINSYLAGNIGTPLVTEVPDIAKKQDPVVVLEVSSFQAEEIVDFKPHIAIVLNLTPDHLDRYPSMQDYLDAKLHMVKNQTHEDVIILNHDDPELLRTLKETPHKFGKARRIWFSVNGTGNENTPGIDAWIANNSIYFRTGNQIETISLKNNPLRGLHNLENITTSAIASRLIHIPIPQIETHLGSFTGLPHRMESVGKIGNIEYINDSKATNVDAAIKSLGSIDEPLILILGGKDKGGNFRQLSSLIREKADYVFLIGKAAKTIQKQLELDGLQEKLIHVTDFNDVVEKSIPLLGEKGGVVLLAPACASFDMFDNFEHRGHVFKETVLTYKTHKNKEVN